MTKRAAHVGRVMGPEVAGDRGGGWHLGARAQVGENAGARRGTAGALDSRMLVSLVVVMLAAPQAEAVPASVVRTAPGRSRVADPWETRAAVRVSASDARWAVDGAEETAVRGGSLDVDLYGRRLGFHLGLAGGASEMAELGTDAVRYTYGEARVGLTAAVNARGVFVGVGPALEARASALAVTSEGADSLTSWQSAVAGGELRARAFAGRRVFVTASAFAGLAPLAGEWQAVNATTEAGVDPFGSGRVEMKRVLDGSLAASLRAAEWIAVSGGVSVREASFAIEGEERRERTVKPFAGVELLF